MSRLYPGNYGSKKAYLDDAGRTYDKYKEEEKKQKLIERMNTPKIESVKKKKDSSEYNRFVQKFILNNQHLKPRIAMAKAAEAWNNGER
jgi:hypothetical protein